MEEERFIIEYNKLINRIKKAEKENYIPRKLIQI